MSKNDSKLVSTQLMYFKYEHVIGKFQVIWTKCAGVKKSKVHKKSQDLTAISNIYFFDSVKCINTLTNHIC